MAYDRRFGINIPTDKQMWKQWTLEQHIKCLEAKVREYYAKETIPYAHLAFKHVQELHKLKRFYEQQIVQHNAPVAYVTQFRNKQAWEQAARQHANVIKQLDVTSDMATDSGKARKAQQSGTDDSDAS